MRKRTKDRHLPKCVYNKNGAFYYVKNNKWKRIGSTLAEALREYAALVEPDANSFPALVDTALPYILKGRADSTKKQYTRCADRAKEVFSEFRPDQITHGHIVRLMDAHSAAVSNRLLTVLKLIFQYAMDRELVLSNPALSVQRKETTSRDRLIADWEYDAVYNACPPWLQIIMDLCYLTGQRIGDILKIERKDLLDDGIFFEQEKTGKRLIVGWTPELRAVVERAKAEHGKVAAFNLLLPARGGAKRQYTTVWQQFSNAAARANVPDFRIHDLRAMSGTDAEIQGMDPTKLLGHTDRRTTQIYLRDKTVKVVQGPRKKAV
ncbi:MAG TPA: integrase [Advenella kashmirensis]|uniref:Integrase n=1 Tax=Advenella kashmirensis TaxID=310575 RepID=A0A356LBF4_9BURK|nr:integrase [Advenella kashmirensis]